VAERTHDVRARSTLTKPRDNRWVNHATDEWRAEQR
jgi:hypothetical protein